MSLLWPRLLFSPACYLLVYYLATCLPSFLPTAIIFSMPSNLIPPPLRTNDGTGGSADGCKFVTKDIATKETEVRPSGCFLCIPVYSAGMCLTNVLSLPTCLATQVDPSMGAGHQASACLK